MAYRLLGGVVPDLAKITIFGGFGAAAQNWWFTADGSLNDYTAILPKVWPTALGTDEGVRPRRAKFALVRRTRAGAAAASKMWVTVVTWFGWRWVGGLADAPLPLAVPGRPRP